MKLAVIAFEPPWTREQGQILQLAYDCAVLAASHPVLEEGVMGGLKDLAKEPFKAANKWGKGQAARHNKVWNDIRNAHAADPTGMGGWKSAWEALKQDTPNLQKAGSMVGKGLSGLGNAFWNTMTAPRGSGVRPAGRTSGTTGGRTPQPGGAPPPGTPPSPTVNKIAIKSITDAKKIFRDILKELDNLPVADQTHIINLVGKVAVEKAKKMGLKVTVGNTTVDPKWKPVK